MVSDRKRLIWLRGMVQTGDLEVSTIEKTTSRVLNEMLVKLFNNIMDAEEKAEHRTAASWLHGRGSPGILNEFCALILWGESWQKILFTFGSFC